MRADPDPVKMVEVAGQLSSTFVLGWTIPSSRQTRRGACYGCNPIRVRHGLAAVDVAKSLDGLLLSHSPYGVGIGAPPPLAFTV